MGKRMEIMFNDESTAIVELPDTPTFDIEVSLLERMIAEIHASRVQRSMLVNALTQMAAMDVFQPGKAGHPMWADIRDRLLYPILDQDN